VETYNEALGVDKEASTKYYDASLRRKTEQQKMLESLLQRLAISPLRIADIACGGGGASFHLAGLFPRAAFTLIDINEAAIEMAREAMRGLQAQCALGDIYDLKLESNSFDLVICWQTLSWIENPQAALCELVRICKTGGHIFASSLFNMSHDVDIYSKVEDHTRPSSALGLRYVYNTYSVASIKKWVGHLVSDVHVHEFDISIDLSPAGSGLGTYTVRLESGKRLQLSAGMLLNWGILELRR
jgi:ubiquinone/menaquinone biosynthesis C-methylase UbiE